ncbi:hypothetical protein [Nocardia veterana]|uniref:DUF4352 domain-containing protein n=1 Tax=Nocardia veterana TaxID=132249 RepID=A0A7X6M3X8_9NOCA|nr:hypothetical protein [Nocardia veterana]
MRRLCWWLVTIAVMSAAGCGAEHRGSMKFGDMATIGSDIGEEGVTVLGIDPGSPADFDQVPDPARFADRTSYYLRYRLTHTSSHGFSFTPFVLSNGSTGFSELSALAGTSLWGLHGADGCTAVNNEQLDLLPPGKSIDGCLIFVSQVGEHTPPTQVQWRQDGNPPRGTWR